MEQAPGYPLNMLLCQGCGVLPVETGFSPFPFGSHSCSELGCSYASWAKGIEGWVRLTTRLFQLSRSAHTHHILLISGTRPQTSGGNPMGSADMSEPTPDRAGAGSPLPPLQPSVGEHMLTPQVPLGHEGGPCPWWVKVPAWLSSTYSSPALKSGDGQTDRKNSARGLGSNFPLRTSVLRSPRRGEVNPQLSSKDLVAGHAPS